MRTDKTTWILTALIGGLILGSVAVWNFILKQTGENRNDARLADLQVVAAKSPRPPTFRLIDEVQGSKEANAGVYQFFRSGSPFSEVRQFYIREIPAQGWSVASTGDDEIVLRQSGDIFLVVERGNSGTDGWDYAVSYVWRPLGTIK